MFLTDHDFVPYYGVTEDEVSTLFTNFEIDGDTQKEVKRHYNGYVSSNHINLYSIWSILNFLQTKKIKNYWQESGVMSNLKEALNISVIRSAVEALCLGKSRY